MSTSTKIEWADATWNPVVGCTRVSEGCRNCYAERFAARFPDRFGNTSRMTEHGPRWTGKVVLRPEVLYKPLRWRKPRRIFVNSMSDLFHEMVPDEFIAEVFAIMTLADRHVFQVLTKRPERMAGLVPCLPELNQTLRVWVAGGGAWPLPNVWLGVSVEDQRAADERIPFLLQTPAAVRFLSCEPLLGPIDLLRACERSADILTHRYLTLDEWGIDWLIAGGETGPGARPMDLDWVRSLRNQCEAAGVPLFIKQMGTIWAREHGGSAKGGDTAYWPEDLQVREMPHAGSKAREGGACRMN